jgi:hypothetical protein
MVIQPGIEHPLRQPPLELIDQPAALDTLDELRQVTLQVRMGILFR